MTRSLNHASGATWNQSLFERRRQFCLGVAFQHDADLVQRGQRVCAVEMPWVKEMAHMRKDAEQQERERRKLQLPMIRDADLRGVTRSLSLHSLHVSVHIPEH